MTPVSGRTTIRVTTQMVVLYFVQTGLITGLVFGRGMSPLAAAALAVAVLVGNCYAATAPGALAALPELALSQLAQSLGIGWGQ
jgi:hypothetical protein